MSKNDVASILTTAVAYVMVWTRDENDAWLSVPLEAYKWFDVVRWRATLVRRTFSRQTWHVLILKRVFAARRVLR